MQPQRPEIRWPRRLMVTFGAFAAVATIVAPPASAQVPAGEPPLETVVVDPASPQGTTSTTILEAYATYRLTVRGVFDYYSFYYGANLADAECSSHRTEPLALPQWQRQRYAVFGTDWTASSPTNTYSTDLWDPDPSDDPLDLYVDHRNIEWIPEVPDQFGCSSTRRYTALFSPHADRQVNFRVFDLHYDDNVAFTNGLEVEIVKVADAVPALEDLPGRHVETVQVHSHVPAGAETEHPLRPGRTYGLVAHGMFNYFVTQPGLGYLADAACSRLDAEPLYRRDRWPDDRLELHVDEEPIDWNVLLPTDPDPWSVGAPTGVACDRLSHYYAATVEGQGEPVRFHITDSWYGDNAGSVSVEVIELPEQTPAGPDGPEAREEVVVEAGDPDGTTSPVPLQAGQSYSLEAAGTWSFGAGEADAHCSTSGGTAFAPSAQNYPPPDFPEGMLRLLVNGTTVEWSATKPDTGQPSCDSTDHAYRFAFVAPNTELLNLRIFDTWYGDNAGSITVRIDRLGAIGEPEAPGELQSEPGPPVVAEEIVLQANDANGATGLVPLQAGEPYRLEATGTWLFGAGQADARCSTSGGTSFAASEDNYGPPTYPADMLRLLVNDAAVQWSPTRPDAREPSCNSSDHTYTYGFVPAATELIELRLNDTWYGDNAGAVTVRVIRLPSGSAA